MCSISLQDTHVSETGLYWLLFNLMSLNVGWMYLPPAQWPGDGDYNRFQNTMTNLKVVNDAAERAVKDVTDFADYTPGQK